MADDPSEIYDLLQVSPWATDQEISGKLSKLKADASDPAMMERLTLAEAQLTDPVKRAVLNAQQLIQADRKQLEEQLAQLRGDGMPEKLPDASLAHAVMEGDTYDIVEVDCQPTARAPALEVDFDGLRSQLADPAIERHVHFDT
ncbi:MAG TPA: hypothetical protein DCR55_09760 [Lentisphaeria bacterium]|jgi:hypothetical protein|nr:hypothetical protein [Lentisphaeria bacterium]